MVGRVRGLEATPQGIAGINPCVYLLVAPQAENIFPSSKASELKDISPENDVSFHLYHCILIGNSG
jgi:hypothetical protein